MADEIPYFMPEMLSGNCFYWALFEDYTLEGESRNRTRCDHASLRAILLPWEYFYWEPSKCPVLYFNSILQSVAVILQRSALHVHKQTDFCNLRCINKIHKTINCFGHMLSVEHTRHFWCSSICNVQVQNLLWQRVNNIKLATVNNIFNDQQHGVILN